MARRRRGYMDIKDLAIAESWASTIAERDPDYKDYAGAPWEIGEALAHIDVWLYILPDDHPLKPLLKLDRLFLIQEKKAYFAGERAGEISILGFLKGGRRIRYPATIDSSVR